MAAPHRAPTGGGSGGEDPAPPWGLCDTGQTPRRRGDSPSSAEQRLPPAPRCSGGVRLTTPAPAAPTSPAHRRPPPRSAPRCRRHRSPGCRGAAHPSPAAAAAAAEGGPEGRWLKEVGSEKRSRGSVLRRVGAEERPKGWW